VESHAQAGSSRAALPPASAFTTTIRYDSLPPYSLYEAVGNGTCSIDEAISTWTDHLRDGSWDAQWLMVFNEMLKYRAQRPQPDPGLIGLAKVQVGAARAYRHNAILAHVLTSAGGILMLTGDIEGGLQYEIEALEVISPSDPFADQIVYAVYANYSRFYPRLLNLAPEAAVTVGLRFVHAMVAVLDRLVDSVVYEPAFFTAVRTLAEIEHALPAEEKQALVDGLAALPRPEADDAELSWMVAQLDSWRGRQPGHANTDAEDAEEHELRESLAARAAIEALPPEERARALVERIIARQPMALAADDLDDTLFAVLALAQAEAEPDSERAEKIRQVTENLCRLAPLLLFGIQLGPPQSDLPLALLDLLRSRTWGAARLVVEAHRELLAPEVDTTLTGVVGAQTSEPARDRVNEIREVLRRCRAIGIARAYAEKIDAHLEVPPELRQDLDRAVATRERVQAEWNRTALDAAIEAWKRLLDSPDLELYPSFSAAVRTNLGATFIDRFQTTGRSNLHDLETGIGLLQQAMEATPQGGQHWAQRQTNLGAGLLMRFEALRQMKDLNAGVAALQQARASMDTSWPEAGLAAANFSKGLLQRFGVTRAPEDLDAAIDSAREALALLPTGSPERVSVSGDYQQALLERFDALGQMRDLKKAVAASRRAFKGLPRDSSAWRIGQANLCSVLIRRFEVLGDVEDLNAAIKSYDRVLKRMHDGSAEWAQILGNKGMALRMRFDLVRWLPDLEAGIDALRRAVTVDDPPSEADRYANLGVALRIYFDASSRPDPVDLDTAVASLERALHAAPEGSLARESIRVSLGNALRTRYDATRALTALDAAIHAYRDALQVAVEGSHYWARWQINLATALERRYAEKGEATDLEGAIDAYQKALRVFDPNLLPGVGFQTARDLGYLLFQQGAWEQAGAALGQAVSALNLLHRAQLLGASREAWLASGAVTYQRAAYALAQSGHVAEAVATLEKGRARGLSQALERDYAELDQVREADPEAYERYQLATLRMRMLESAERAENVATRTGSAARSAAGLIKQARQARADLETAIARIQRVHGHEDFLAEPKFDDVERAVEPDRPLAYLVTTPAGSVALLVHRAVGAASASVEAVWAHELATSDLDALLVSNVGQDRLGGYLIGQLFDPGALDSALADSLPVLGEKLIAPIAARLREWKAAGVVLIPSGRLGLLPLHVASYRGAGHNMGLIDEVDVSYAPSARVLIASRTALARRPAGAKVLVGVGNPMPNPTPLRFARAELAVVLGFFPDDARPLFEEEATVVALFSRLAGATYVHLACHGQFDLEEPLSSHLQLADPEPLTLLQILDQVRLRDARLVVLTACQTAITDFRHLPDETIGFPSGFLQAGVPGVVGTLWSVDDVSTGLVMAKFYELHLVGDPDVGSGPMPPVRALRLAQRWLRDVTVQELFEQFVDVRSSEPAPVSGAAHIPVDMAQGVVERFGWEDPKLRPYADSPYDWAPFVFIGA